VKEMRQVSLFPLATQVIFGNIVVILTNFVPFVPWWLILAGALHFIWNLGTRFTDAISCFEPGPQVTYKDIIFETSKPHNELNSKTKTFFSRILELPSFTEQWSTRPDTHKFTSSVIKILYFLLSTFFKCYLIISKTKVAKNRSHTISSQDDSKITNIELTQPK
jgi:hypothetical protein